MEEHSITLHKNQVASVNGVRVGCSNFAEYTYQDAQETTREGPTALLTLPDDVSYRVGKGAEVTIGGKVWKVEAVTLGANPEVVLVPR